ncbi:GNAT family N-acetyltransferase [Paenibacillus sp.]|uniref:GNAT family N-acetyltransferase n=1 Tax=Paenibacillus sp. TaxID=58172 RepID=UPI002D6D7186|nr:GNAT family N-acetyltransferase [Paenibacillus sp.]HZG85487.1 GNAT family N-acetyltransferase [Paenibacillus sp.]
MIRKLTELDRRAVLALAGEEPSYNLFIIGDVENFGFDADFQELWGEFGERGRLKAVLLRYYGSYLPYAAGEFDVAGFAERIREGPGAEMVSGPSHVAERFRSEFAFRREKQMYFAERPASCEAPLPDAPEENVRVASAGDIEAVCALLDGIAEFDSNGSARRDSMRLAIESGTGRTYFVERDGRVVATASTSAENSMSAMVVGVATHPDYRGQGLATRVTSKLCADAAAEGRTLCLFYDNPDAGSIYKRIGFRDIGRWSILYF